MSQHKSVSYRKTVVLNNRPARERELNVSISEDEWGSIWKYAKSISACNHAKAIQFKIVHRMHISPNNRYVCNNIFSHLRLKCKTQIVSLSLVMPSITNILSQDNCLNGQY